MHLYVPNAQDVYVPNAHKMHLYVPCVCAKYVMASAPCVCAKYVCTRWNVCKLNVVNVELK